MSGINTEEKARLVSETVLKFPTVPNLTLGRILYKQHRRLFPTVDAAYQAVRYRRGVHGASNRKRPGRIAVPPPPHVWQFPHSSAPSYAPIHLEAERTLILSDLHIPFHDSEAIHAVIGEGKKRDPDCILLNGDVCDFFSISRFDKNPTESSLKKELNLTRQFLGWLRQTFPQARIIYKLGNHDEWLDKYLHRKAPELFGLEALTLENLVTGIFKGSNLEEVHGIEFIDDQRKIMAGKLNIWHGHEVGKGSIAPPVNPARGLFMRTLECGLMGHLHKDSMHTETTAAGKLVACWSTGCLCGLWPKYARVNKWTHSAAFLELNRGMFNITPIRIHRGQVL